MREDQEKGGYEEGGISDTWFETRHQRWTGKTLTGSLGTDRSGLTDRQVSWGCCRSKDSATEMVRLTCAYPCRVLGGRRGGWRQPMGVAGRTRGCRPVPTRQVVRRGAGSEVVAGKKNLSPSLTSCPTWAGCSTPGDPGGTATPSHLRAPSSSLETTIPGGPCVRAAAALQIRPCKDYWELKSLMPLPAAERMVIFLEVVVVVGGGL